MKRVAAIMLGVSLCGGVARAYTAAERQFCEPEAKRLCSIGQILEAGLGNYGGIIACFNTHRRELSRACVDAIRKAHGK